MPIRHVTLHQLKIFDALAQHMSVSRTAEALHLTPPAVSIQVKQLSDAAGKRLFEKMGKKIYLTDAGKDVAAACRDIFERLDYLALDLAALDKMEKGNLRIAITTMAKVFLPRLLGKFIEKYNGIEASLFVGNRQQVLERLRKNQDDIYILGKPPEYLKVNSFAFAPNHVVAVAYPQHHLAKKKSISPKSLENEPFIVREEGSGIRQATMNFFASNNVFINVRMEIGSNDVVKQIVMARLGIAFLARSVVDTEIENGELVMLDIEGLPIERHWHVVYSEQKRLSLPAEKFRTFLISEYGYFTS